MNKIYLIVLCFFATSCATKQVYISDIDAERKTSSKSTVLERIVSDNESKDSGIGIAVLIGIDDDGKNYLAVAPAPNFGVSLINIKPTHIRALEINEAKELLKAISFATDNYDKKVSELQSINSSYLSYLQSNTVLLQGNYLSPILSDFLTFTFVNNEEGAEARMYFTNSPDKVKDLALENREFNKEELQHLSFLLNTALTKASIKQ